MKREIEFRGFIRNNNYEEKVVVNGELFRGYWCYWNEFGVVAAEENCKDIYLNEHCCYYGIVEKNRVIPETVGQYTGIKDKNGEKIFEHDIVKVTVCSSYDCYVCFKDYAWCFVPFDEKVKEVKFGVLKHADYEVIGTIFDKENDNGD